jgi:hypothetical protein
MNTITREGLHKMLVENECIVEFTKVNGDKREMPCTLKESLIPPQPIKVHVTNTDNPVDFPKVKKDNPATMSVWCTDKQAWRSFRVSNVTSVKVKE